METDIPNQNVSFGLDSLKNANNWVSNDGVVIKTTRVNLVYTCNINTKINLNHVVQALSFMGPQLNKKRFSSVIFRYRSPKIAILLFSQGKIVCTGAKNQQQARYMIYDIVQKLKQHGYKNAQIVADGDGKTGLHIQNLVSSAIFPWKIKLDKLSLNNSAYCTYDPEVFPGVITRYTPISPMTVLVFESGNMVITGAKSQEDVFRALEQIYPLIRPFAIQSNRKSTENLFIKPNEEINEIVRKEEKNKKLKAETPPTPKRNGTNKKKQNINSPKNNQSTVLVQSESTPSVKIDEKPITDRIQHMPTLRIVK